MAFAGLFQAHLGHLGSRMTWPVTQIPGVGGCKGHKIWQTCAFLCNGNFFWTDWARQLLLWLLWQWVLGFSNIDTNIFFLLCCCQHFPHHELLVLGVGCLCLCVSPCIFQHWTASPNCPPMTSECSILSVAFIYPPLSVFPTALLYCQQISQKGCQVWWPPKCRMCFCAMGHCAKSSDNRWAIVLNFVMGYGQLRQIWLCVVYCGKIGAIGQLRRMSTAQCRRQWGY
jgi:hypothetical protein